jgi:hypothetical protein
VSDEWGATEHPDVRISASWRVFEISSGDEDEGGNYGERDNSACTLSPLSTLIWLIRFATPPPCIHTAGPSWDIDPLPVELLYRFLAGQGFGL